MWFLNFELNAYPAALIIIIGSAQSARDVIIQDASKSK